MSDSEDNAPKSHRRRLFIKDGRPARFFFHRSIHRESQRQNLRADIEAYGGRVASTDHRVDTVLISATSDRDLLRLRYGADPDKHKRAVHVERLSFVQGCIQTKKFEHRVPMVKGMGGQLGRKTAVEFTPSDDENLCGYLARVQPRKEAGGRLGNQIYKQLIELGEECPDTFSWVKRHTFHSWRERYKKNQHKFDPIIKQIAMAEGTYDKPLWKEDRRMSRRRLRRGRHFELQDSSEEEYEPQEEEEEEEEEEDQLREEEEEGELSPQPEDRHVLDGDEYRQEIEGPQDSGLEGQQVQDVELEPSEIKKLKRVQPGAVPGHISKKRRSSYPVNAKGKEIAFESDQGSDGDEEMAKTSLFSIDMNEEVPFENDEPGPSNVVRSQDRSRVGLSRSDQQMDFTQETLVNTQSRVEFEAVSHSTSANRRHSGHSQPISRIKEDEEPESPRLQPAPPPPVQRLTPGTSKGLQDAPTMTNQPVSSGPKLRSKQKISTIVQRIDAPYRNTRARSRSVEPVAMPPPTFAAMRRKKQKPEAVEKEVREEALTGPTPIIEAIEEEMDVEHILMTKDANMSTTIRARDPSLETDDAQTRRSLHVTATVSGSSPARKTYISNKIKASDVLGKFESSNSSKYYKQRPPTQDDPGLNENRRPRRGEPQISSGASKLPEPRTPMNVHRTRLESISSAASFPLEGTRASAAKKKRQEQEKYIPYKPLEGTRAAQFASSR